MDSRNGVQAERFLKKQILKRRHRYSERFLKNRFKKTTKCKYLPSAESTREVTWPVPAAPTRPTRPDTITQSTIK